MSNHLLHPIVGIAAERPVFRIAEAEVARLIEVPLSHLRAPETVRWEQRVRERPPSVLMDVPYFDVDGARVWGATAMVLAEFLAVLDAVDAVRTASRFCARMHGAPGGRGAVPGPISHVPARRGLIAGLRRTDSYNQ